MNYENFKEWTIRIFIYPHIYIYIYIYIYEGSLNKFPDFFRMGIFIDSTHDKI